MLQKGKAAWRWTSAVILAACAACDPGGGRQPDGVPELPELDRAKFSGPIFPLLERAYQQAKSQPYSASASGRLGMTLQAYGQHDAALQAYQRALALAPGGLRWQYLEAVALESSGQDQEAINAFKLVLEIDPDYLPARIRMADLMLRGGRTEAAAAVYDALAAEHPDSAATHFGLGRLRVARDDFAGAVTHLRRACELAPRYSPARYALSMALQRVGETDAAEREMALFRSAQGGDLLPFEDSLFEEVTALKFESPLHNIEEGRRLEAAGSLAEAAAAYSRALEIDPRSVQAHVNLLSVFGSMGNYRKAEQHYREALAISSDLEELHYNYGNVMALQGRATEAVKAYEKALSINPTSAESHNNLGYVLETLGRRKDANAHYKEALRVQPDHRLAHYHLGRGLMAGGDYGEAVVHLEQAAKLTDEKTPRILFELARAYLAVENRDAALRSASRARRLAVAMGQGEMVALIDRELGER